MGWLGSTCTTTAEEPAVTSGRWAPGHGQAPRWIRRGRGQGAKPRWGRNPGRRHPPPDMNFSRAGRPSEFLRTGAGDSLERPSHATRLEGLIGGGFLSPHKIAGNRAFLLDHPNAEVGQSARRKWGGHGLLQGYGDDAGQWPPAIRENPPSAASTCVETQEWPRPAE